MSKLSGRVYPKRAIQVNSNSRGLKKRVKTTNKTKHKKTPSAYEHQCLTAEGREEELTTESQSLPAWL